MPDALLGIAIGCIAGAIVSFCIGSWYDRTMARMMTEHEAEIAEIWKQHYEEMRSLRRML